MEHIKKSVTELIGHTPLLEPANYMAANEIRDVRILTKLEFLNLGEKKSALVCALSVGLMFFCLGIFICTLTGKGNRLLKAGLSLLLGGGFSNTYDRLTRRYVVDYFSFRTGIKALDRVVFNLADFAIMIGAMCAALGA